MAEADNGDIKDDDEWNGDEWNGDERKGDGTDVLPNIDPSEVDPALSPTLLPTILIEADVVDPTLVSLMVCGRGS